MGKKFLLSAIAISAIVSAASAGVIDPKVNGQTLGSTNEINVSNQWIQKNALLNKQSDVNISLEEIYEPTKITLSSMKNPVLNIKFSNVKNINDNLSGTYVCEVNASGYPLPQPAVLKYNSNNGIDSVTYIATNANVYFNNGHYYGFFKDINESNCSELADGTAIDSTNLSQTKVQNAIELTLSKAAPVDATFTLGTGDSQQVQDTAVASHLINVGNQFIAEVTTPFDNKIDPNSGFIAFNTTQNSCSTTYATSDNVDISLYSDACGRLNTSYMVNDLYAMYTIHSNMPLPFASKNPVTVSINNINNNSPVISDDNTTVSFTNEWSNLAANDVNDTETFTFTLDGVHQIPTADFTVDLKLDLNKDKKPDLTVLDNADAGQWTYNGTSLKTPYVAVNSDTQTIIRINNGSNLNAQVYWTCTDDNGVTVQNIQVPSAIYKLNYIKPNGADAWLMSSVLKAAQAKNPDFAPDGKMRCSALVTSTSGVSGLEIMTINGARDRVIPITTSK